MNLLVSFLATAVFMASLAESSRILAFLPIPAKSHQRVIQPLLRELALRGHHVTSYTPYPLDNPPKNYTEVKLPDFMSKMQGKMQKDTGDAKEWWNYLKSNPAKILAIFWKFMSCDLTEWITADENVRSLIDSDLQFDLVILETTFLQEPFIALGHKFKAPVVEFQATGNMHWSYWIHGNPIDTSYIQEEVLPFTDRMTFPQRLFNTFLSLWVRFFNVYILGPRLQAVMDQNIRYPGWETRPPMLEMIADTSLVLVNTHFSVNYPYPSAPHVKEVGGLNIVKTPNPLPKDLQTFMDSAKDGVIYFTLGSHIQVSGMLGEKLRVVFSKVFSELKQKVLWKWETDFPDIPSNVKISKWFPQQDILAHKNCILFITHGGMLSMVEAVYQGIATVGIPIMPDQDKNVVHMEHYKYGVQLQPANITYESLKWAVNEVLHNPMYRENAKKQSQLYRDKPESALETAVFWTEYVIRHNGAHHLKPAIATMPWYQEALIDVYAAIALFILLHLYLFYKVTCSLCRMISRLTSKKGKKNENDKAKKTQ